MFKYLFLATALLVASTNSADYRPFISTQLAKAIMLSDNVPDDNQPKKLCDGSGWIKHMDGHKTPCPGCEACEGDEPTAGCQCGCGKPDCKCSVSSSCETKAVAEPKPTLFIYHMGADWCPPCVRLKRETWSDAELKKFMSDNGVELYTFDNDKPEHAKYFEYYNVSTLPTIIILRSDDLNNPIESTVGFKDSKAIQALLKSKMTPDEQ